MSYTSEQKYEAMKLFATGHSLAEVCSATGVADYSARKLKALTEERKIDVSYRVQIWDIETTDFKADIGTLMVSSFLDLDTGVPNSRTVLDFDEPLESAERQLAEWTIGEIAKSDVLIGHNIKAFDRNFLSGVAARSGLPLVPKRDYRDTMLIHRYGVKGKMGSSMANIADVYGLPIPKDAPSKNDWRRYIGRDPAAVARITERCELDVIVNALIWEKLKPYYYEWRGER
jgi:hypothetical protein